MTSGAAVIGLGAIGMGYDLALPRTHVLTHARAFAGHPAFELLGAVDPDAQLRAVFTETYGRPAFATLDDLRARLRPEVLAVAAPTELHAPLVTQALGGPRPRAILCEKPLAASAGDTERLAADCSAAGVPLFVNFIRRGDPGVQEVRARLVSGTIAAPFKAIGWYSKGLRHNGSHFADLLQFWFGPIRSAGLVAPGRPVHGDDAEPDVRFVFDRGAAVLCAAREEDFSHYTLEVVAANGRLRYDTGGRLFWQGIEPIAAASGHRRLAPEVEEIRTGMDRYQEHVADQLALALAGEAHSLCTAAEAAPAQGVLERLIEENAQRRDGDG